MAITGDDVGEVKLFQNLLKDTGFAFVGLYFSAQNLL